MTAEEIIRHLELAPHPEGGYFAEVFRADSDVRTTHHPSARRASTAIYFLLRADEFSALHRVSSDEVWHHYAGDALELHTLDENRHDVALLGADLAVGARPLRVVPRGVWQAARIAKRAHGYALCGCTVAPGFEFSDFEMPSRAELLERLPRHAAAIRELTRP
jgi:predicted cupin superfamily sugar epimerase